MITLDDVKAYAKIDYDDDDSFIENLIDTAKTYIENSTGKAYAGDNKVYNLAILYLVAYWYENRMMLGNTNVAEIPYTVQALLTHLLICQKYQGDANA